MRMIIVTSLFAIALLGAVLSAIGVHGSTRVSAGDGAIEQDSRLQNSRLQKSPRGTGPA